ncbi:MAG: trypsin-like peptidase domain-containing protein [Thermodesulfobacteriota bacterium]
MSKSRTLSLTFFAALALAALVCAPAARADRAARTTPTVRAVQQMGPAVVNIASKTRAQARIFRSGDELFDRFFEEFFQPMARERSSLGSGFIFDGGRGLIVTNSHVVSAASEITVLLSDQRAYPAQVVGADPATDLAVLRIRAQNHLPQARLGNSDDIMIGEDVIAIGNPFGLSHTVTRGVVSALGRKVRTGRDEWMHDLIQIDASINPGNSGGPLLNLDGEVIGINTAIFQNAQGIGFAIPVNRVRRVVEDLVRYGEVVPAWLGLELQDLTPDLAAQFGLAGRGGALISAVMADSPAAEAGLARGQVVVSLDGRPVNDVSDYGLALAGAAVGRELALGVFAQGRAETVRLTPRAFPLERAMEVAWRRLGFSVAELSAEVARLHRARPGGAVMIERLREGGPAQKVGLRPGDLVLQVGEGPTPEVDAFLRQVAKQRLMPRLTVLIQRGQARQFITLGP